MAKSSIFLRFWVLCLAFGGLVACGETKTVGLRYNLPASNGVNPDFTVVLSANSTLTEFRQNLTLEGSTLKYYDASEDLLKCVVHLGHLEAIGSVTAGASSNCTAYAQSLVPWRLGTKPSVDPLSTTAETFPFGTRGYLFVIFVFESRQCVQIFGAEVRGGTLTTRASGQVVTSATPDFTLAEFPSGGGLPSTCFALPGS